LAEIQKQIQIDLIIKLPVKNQAETQILGQSEELVIDQEMNLTE
jgi:hypothetical protein